MCWNSSQSLAFLRCALSSSGRKIIVTSDETRKWKIIHLNFWSADPSDSGQFLLQQEMIRFVIETPLTNGQCGTCRLYLIDHFGEFFALVFAQFLIILHRSDVQLMFRFRLWRLKRTRQYRQLNVLQSLNKSIAQNLTPTPWNIHNFSKIPSLIKIMNLP